jgi:hypothetical protein
MPLSGLRAIMGRLAQDWSPPDKDLAPLEYQLLAEDGEVLLDSVLHQEGLLNLRRLELPSAQRVLSGRPGYVEEHHVRTHASVLTGYARVHDPPAWAVLVRVERARVVAPLWADLWRYGGPGAIVLLMGWGTVQAWGAVRRGRDAAFEQETRGIPLQAQVLSVPSAHTDRHSISMSSATQQKPFGRSLGIHDTLTAAIERLARRSTSSGLDRWLFPTVDELGRASGASRLSVFRRSPASEPSRMELYRRWTKDNGPREGAPTPLDEHAWPPAQWQARLERGELLSVEVADQPDPPRARLLGEGVQSSGRPGNSRPAPESRAVSRSGRRWKPWSEISSAAQRCSGSSRRFSQT